MKLLTQEVVKRFKKHPFGSQDGKGQKAKVLVKYFNPVGSGTWLITEAENQDGVWILFGYCHILDWEWGYVTLKELQKFKGRFGLGIERDLHISDSATVSELTAA